MRPRLNPNDADQAREVLARLVIDAGDLHNRIAMSEFITKTGATLRAHQHADPIVGKRQAGVYCASIAGIMLSEGK